MNKVDFLECLKIFTNETMENFILPVRFQKGDTEAQQRAPLVYLMRVPDSSSAAKKAPYILHQVITGSDAQPEGKQTTSTACLRSIFCVYYENEEEGALALLELMERFRIAVLKKRIINGRYQLNIKKEPMQTLIYPDDTAPYYMGEVISYWTLPQVEQEVPYV